MMAARVRMLAQVRDVDRTDSAMVKVMTTVPPVNPSDGLATSDAMTARPGPAACCPAA
jgi:hypothetical protein